MSSPMDYTRFEPPVASEPWDRDFTVEIYIGQKENHGWELWSEGLEWGEVQSDCELLKKRGFKFRVKDERDVVWEI